MKKSGLLLAISSLPSQFGIGDLGKSAYEFVDILKQANTKIWQVLPLTPLGFGNSPYQSSSSFAGDEIYISLEKLADYGLLEESSLKSLNVNSDKVEYELVRDFKDKYLEEAFSNFQSSKDKFEQEYNNFIAQNAWVKNYAIFKAFRKANNYQAWNFWSLEYKNWIKDKAIELNQFQNEIDYQIFLQFIFYKQWFDLREYANQNNIEIMGDLPIYLGFDSADVWEHQDIFLLDENQNPSFVAGVPPDFFSETGQLWGNPLYDWDKLKETNFEFWIERLKGNFRLFDIVRIDHFRAFDTYWKIPAGEKTAINGEWIEAPGYDFFDTVYKRIPDANIIAEDLGDLRPEVLELRDHYKLKGMKVFPFHFDFKTAKFVEDSNIIAYSGTHDNNTLKGWYFDELNRYQRKLLKKYFKANDRNIFRKIIKYLLNCDAEYVILPVQDILELGREARLNTPGTVGSPNWQWKLSDFDLLRTEV
ncbi:4-alpha-glucanotransferase [Francisella philomiragia]|uniref:4-alpha-glucanotransferase n=1 Tax=Francisella philomiragia subsp. philomiragia (strain ATCC 25017 / CCUG 19701 / FSC 153 / O\|nr:4-alpha-glucanotransferase [Francisella philomiragia]AJI47821.1 4-alpha-glucanotransferase [Francisella philomiragia]AJI49318.1 4-alpha-glucanotransferase [Francisella philomiragia]MBK2020844.1 4-alpha-glucanotransferase [Francisella philomiragia]MBK2030204.1 4-alpha-glucanotransferase [Francisella philomiragia]MBK2264692.1 4-alpha-glucanotransferase [Francisella philomiragia]